MCVGHHHMYQCIIGFLEREERENRAERRFEEIIYKDFPDLVKDMKLHIQKV